MVELDDTSAPTCFAVFNSGLEGKQLQDEVFKNFPGGNCEDVQTSPYSPGPVRLDETLTKLIVHPIHFDPETGQLSPMAFVDATTIDLSLFREETASNDEIQLAIDQIRQTGFGKLPPQQRLIQLVMHAECKDIKALTFDDDKTRMCFIYDTATENKPNHASVFTPTSARKGSRQRQVKKKLFDLFSQRIVMTESYRQLAY